MTPRPKKGLVLDFLCQTCKFRIAAVEPAQVLTNTKQKLTSMPQFQKTDHHLNLLLDVLRSILQLFEVFVVIKRALRGKNVLY